MMKLITKAQAVSSGLPRYFTGKACPRGHISERYTIRSRCVKCHEEFSKARPDVSKKWKDKNRQRVIEQTRQWRKDQLLTYPWYYIYVGSKERGRKVGYDLDKEWFIKNWTGKCALTGVTFDLNRDRKEPNPMGPSLDRIDPTQGYLKNNCRFILQCINSFKGRMSDEQMLTVARIMIENV